MHSQVNLPWSHPSSQFRSFVRCYNFFFLSRSRTAYLRRTLGYLTEASSSSNQLSIRQKCCSTSSHSLRSLPCSPSRGSPLHRPSPPPNPSAPRMGTTSTTRPPEVLVAQAARAAREAAAAPVALEAAVALETAETVETQGTVATVEG